MIVVLGILAVQASALTRQPKTVEIVEYREVESALANGAPDPNVADNFFVRITSRYCLLADSDAVTPDADGTRQFHIPPTKIEGQEFYTENKRAPKTLGSAFTRVSISSPRPDFRKHQTFQGSTGELDQPIYKGNHCVVYVCDTRTEEVETHMLGKRRFTRTHVRDGSSISTNMVYEGQYYDPAGNRSLWNGKFDARVDSPTYTY